MPEREHSSEATVLRVGAHAELVALADAVLGAGQRYELALLDVGVVPAESGARVPVPAESGARVPVPAESGARVPVPAESGARADVVWAGPDDVSRLHHSGELPVALRAARARLRPGGLVLLPAPEPAELKALHAVAPVAVQLGVDAVAGPVGVWDFTAGGARSYSCEELLLRRSPEGWTVQPVSTTWFEVPTEAELRSLLGAAGYLGVQRLSASETGLSCAVWAAVAPSPAREVG